MARHREGRKIPPPEAVFLYLERRMAPSEASGEGGQCVFFGVKLRRTKRTKGKYYLPSLQHPSPSVAMYYVYCLRSKRIPSFRYVGFSADLRQRILDHNRGCTHSTAAYRPLQLDGYAAFTSKHRALAFERYLKSGSGHAFAKKRLW